MKYLEAEELSVYIIALSLFTTDHYKVNESFFLPVLSGFDKWLFSVFPAS